MHAQSWGKLGTCTHVIFGTLEGIYEPQLYFSVALTPDLKE